MRLPRPLAFLPCVLLAAGCRPAAPPPPAPPPPAVTVVRPVAVPVQSYLEYNGYLDSVETVQVKARVKGILSKIHFTEGDDIAAGDTLYTIDPREYVAAVAKAEADIEKADADTANADAQIKLAEADLERLKKVGPAAAPTELDKAVATVAANVAMRKIAVANRHSAEAARDTAKLDLEYATIKAPIKGRINRTLVTQGNLVGQNETTLLTTIVRMDKLYVYFDAPERDLVEYLRAARETSAAKSLDFELGVATEVGHPHRGAIDFRENRVDPGTGTIRVRGWLDNPAGPDGKQRSLYPGLFTRVKVPAGPKVDRVVVPEDAVMTGQEGTYLYVLDDKNVVQKRTVKLIPGPPVWRSPAEKTAAPEWSLVNPKPADGKPADLPLRSVVAIATGLEVKDVVIVTGLQKARPGAPVAPDEWTFRAPAAR